MNFPVRRSLLGKIIFSTSVAITLLLAAAGWVVQDVTRKVLSDNLRNEIQGSLRAYESLWKSRAEMLRSVTRALSNMSDVRRAFQTNDRATIQDTAAEFWGKVSQSSSGGIFLVTDPRGEVIASLGGSLPGQGKEAFLAGVLGVRAIAADPSAGSVDQSGVPAQQLSGDGTKTAPSRTLLAGHCPAISYR